MSDKQDPSHDDADDAAAGASLDDVIDDRFVESPHDGLFRRVFADLDVVRAELRAALPGAIVERLDLSVLEPVDRSFVSRELRAHYSDAFYRTRLCDRDAAVYLLFEHKSAPDRFALVQLLVYLGQAYDSLRRAEPPPEYLPLILPVLFTHAPGGWKASVRFQDLLDPVGRTRRRPSAPSPRWSQTP